MLRRCYNSDFHEKQLTYKDCTVSDNFRYFHYFKDWCGKQIGYTSVDVNGKDFHLDKDILVKGNKVYSEDTCCFVPCVINNLLNTCENARGSNIIGVYYNKRTKQFFSGLNRYGEYTHLGYFTTELEAFLSYKTAKEAYVKEVANMWKDQIDPRVYEVLMNWEISSDD